MEIKFLEDIDLEVITGVDGRSTVITEHRSLRKDEVCHVPKLSTRNATGKAMIMFDSGSIAYGVPLTSFDILG